MGGYTSWPSSMTSRPIRHRVEHTKNKHSRAVLKDGTIVIRLAKNLSKKEQREHIDSLLERMKDQVKEEQKKIALHPFRRLLDEGESIGVRLANGTKYTIILKPGKVTRVQRTMRGWNISVAPRMRRQGLHRLLWKIISEQEHARVEALVRKLNEETYGVNVSKVQLKFASSQWGSCSSRGVIMINTALLFAPSHLLRYVIIHELAHRKRADHSPMYWSWVEWAMPSYKRTRNELQEYRLPNL